MPSYAPLHRLGELRDRSYKDQQGRASGLTLLMAAIGLWNAVYLERLVAELRVPAVEVVTQDPAVGKGMKGAVEVDLAVSLGPSKRGNIDRGAGPAVSGHGVGALPTKAERGVGGAGIIPGRTEPPSGRGDATSGGSAGDDQYR